MMPPEVAAVVMGTMLVVAAIGICGRARLRARSVKPATIVNPTEIEDPAPLVPTNFSYQENVASALVLEWALNAARGRHLDECNRVHNAAIEQVARMYERSHAQDEDFLAKIRTLKVSPRKRLLSPISVAAQSTLRAE
jgi:hypothetical protein